LEKFSVFITDPDLLFLEITVISALGKSKDSKRLLVYVETPPPSGGRVETMQILTSPTG
jgi:hypothetical protein